MAEIERKAMEAMLNNLDRGDGNLNDQAYGAMVIRRLRHQLAQSQAREARLQTQRDEALAILRVPDGFTEMMPFPHMHVAMHRDWLEFQDRIKRGVAALAPHDAGGLGRR